MILEFNTEGLSDEERPSILYTPERKYPRQPSPAPADTQGEHNHSSYTVL